MVTLRSTLHAPGHAGVRNPEIPTFNNTLLGPFYVCIFYGVVYGWEASRDFRRIQSNMDRFVGEISSRYACVGCSIFV